MKFYYFLFISFFFNIHLCFAQYLFSNGNLQKTTVYSKNRIYKITSISYDDEFPTNRGKSTVYENGKELYSIHRSFDIIKNNTNTYLTISNDGQTVAYFVTKRFFNDDEHKHVTIYQHGKLKKAYTLDEFTGCNSEVIECELFYNNSRSIIDTEKSDFSSKPVKIVYKENISPEELFLNSHVILNKNDTVYSTNSQKNTTVLDLKTGEIIEIAPFSKFYQKIKNHNKAKMETSYYKMTYLYINDFVNRQTNKKSSEEIADLLNMKYVDLSSSKRKTLKEYQIHVTGFLNQNGMFEIESLEAEPPIKKELIESYFQSNRFKSDSLPKEIEKHYFKYFFGSFRNVDTKIARKERDLEILKEEQTHATNLKADSINHVYIPKDLNDCFIQLNKILKPIDIEKIKSSKGIDYHMGLGMWIRNN